MLEVEAELFLGQDLGDVFLDARAVFSRTRATLSCNNEAVVNDPNDCPQSAITPVEVSQMSEWNEWSPCSASCGANGIQKRQRSCSSPADVGIQNSGIRQLIAAEKPVSPTITRPSYSIKRLSNISGSNEMLFKFEKTLKGVKETKYKRNRISHGRSSRKQRNTNIQNSITDECARNIEEVRKCDPLPSPCEEYSEWTEWVNVQYGLIGRNGVDAVHLVEVDNEVGFANVLRETNAKAKEHKLKRATHRSRVYEDLEVSVRFFFQQYTSQPTIVLQFDCLAEERAYLWGEWSDWLPCSETCGEGLAHNGPHGANGHYAELVRRARHAEENEHVTLGLYVLETQTWNVLVGPSRETESCEAICNIVARGVKIRNLEKSSGSENVATSTPNTVEVTLSRGVYDTWQAWQPCSVSCGGEFDRVVMEMIVPMMDLRLKLKYVMSKIVRKCRCGLNGINGRHVRHLVVMVDNLGIVNVKLRSYSSVMVLVTSNVHAGILLVSFYREARHPLLLDKDLLMDNGHHGANGHHVLQIVASDRKQGAICETALG
uniref:Uncharacterized protein n=1 Tax=Parascaris univalens TaxID=6257 RepID=A0A915A9W0_PARUN